MKSMLETQYKDITYYSQADLWTLETDIFFILEGHWTVAGFNYETDINTINKNLRLYDLGLWQYLLESDNVKYLHNLTDDLEKKWTVVEWFFERNNKHYLILYRPKIDWEIRFNTDKVNKIL